MRVFFAILCSIVFHGVVAILLALAIQEFSKDSATVDVSLDLSQVELSFSENEAASEPALPMPPSPSIEEVRPEEAPPPELNAAEEKIESFSTGKYDVKINDNEFTVILHRESIFNFKFLTKIDYHGII